MFNSCKVGMKTKVINNLLRIISILFILALFFIQTPKLELAAADVTEEIEKFSYTVNESDNTLKIVRYNGSEDYDLKIPSIMVVNDKEYRVTSIDDAAFKGADIRKVTIPSSILYIGTDCFANTGITDLIFEDLDVEDGPLTIGRAIIYQSYGIKEIIFPKRLAFMEQSIFSRSHLESVEFRGTPPSFSLEKGWPSKSITNINKIVIPENMIPEYIMNIPTEMLTRMNSSVTLSESSNTPSNSSVIALESEEWSYTVSLPETYSWSNTINQWEETKYSVYKNNLDNLICDELDATYIIKEDTTDIGDVDYLFLSQFSHEVFSVKLLRSMVVFHSEHGSPPDPIRRERSVKIDISNLDIPISDEYTFLGWEYGNQLVSEVILPEDGSSAVLNARWWKKPAFPIDDPTVFPYSSAVYVAKRFSAGNLSRGSGVVIGKDYILTAGHVNNGWASVKIIPAIDSYYGEDKPFGEWIGIREESITSPDYVGGYAINDYAIIKVAPQIIDGVEVHIGDVVKPLTVQKNVVGNEINEGDVLRFIGYPSYAGHLLAESSATIVHNRNNSRVSTVLISTGGGSGGALLNDIDQVIGTYHGGGEFAVYTDYKVNLLLEWGLKNEKSRVYFCENKDEWDVVRRLIEPEGNYIETNNGEMINIFEKIQEKPGYKFLYFTDGFREYKSPEIEMAIGGLVLYPVYNSNKYNILFESNEGSGTMDIQERYFDDGLLLQKNEYIRKGYNFKNWNTKRDGSGYAYNDEEIGNLTENNDETITLFAQWEAQDQIIDNTAKLATPVEVPKTGDGRNTIGNIIILLLVGNILLFFLFRPSK